MFDYLCCASILFHKLVRVVEIGATYVSINILSLCHNRGDCDCHPKCIKNNDCCKHNFASFFLCLVALVVIVLDFSQES